MGIRKNIYDDKHWCVMCRDFRPLSEFTVAESGAIPSRCKMHVAEYWKKYYPAHREHKLRYNRGYTWERKMTVLTAYGGKCVDCGIDNPLVLEVHHKDRKEAKEQKENGFKTWRGTSRTVNQYYGWLIAENFPPRFEVLCKNCHHLRHLTKPRVT